VKCDCGKVEHVPYGERWHCPSCGREWNTNQIPADQYWGIMREMRTYRLQAIGVALGIGALFLVLALFAGPRAFIAAPVVMSAWFLFYMPFWRLKVRRRSRSLPTWQLTPE
jgi:hypothetical protein